MDLVEKYFNSRSLCNLRRLLLRSCEIKISVFAELMFTMSNNIRLKELDASNNNLLIRKDIKNGDKVKIKDNLSTFMLSNKTMNHLIISDCNIDRKTAELIVSIFMLRPSMILVHTNSNPQIFDAVSLIDTNWYMKV